MDRGDAWHWIMRLKSNVQQVIVISSMRHENDNRGFWLGLRTAITFQAVSLQKSGKLLPTSGALAEFCGSEFIRYK